MNKKPSKPTLLEKRMEKATKLLNDASALCYDAEMRLGRMISNLKNYATKKQLIISTIINILLIFGLLLLCHKKNVL